MEKIIMRAGRRLLLKLMNYDSHYLESVSVSDHTTNDNSFLKQTPGKKVCE